MKWYPLKIYKIYNDVHPCVYLCTTMYTCHVYLCIPMCTTMYTCVYLCVPRCKFSIYPVYAHPCVHACDYTKIVMHVLSTMQC